MKFETKIGRDPSPRLAGILLPSAERASQWPLLPESRSCGHCRAQFFSFDHEFHEVFVSLRSELFWNFDQH